MMQAPHGGRDGTSEDDEDDVDEDEVDEIEVVVGRIGRPHGLRGELTVELRTDEPERRWVAGARLRAEAPRGSSFTASSLVVESVRWHQGTLLVRFEGVADRTAAEAVRDVVVHALVDAHERPEDPEEYYDHQLVGLGVLDEAGARIGEVIELVHGAQDLLVVRTPDGRDALVPFVAALVPRVDLDEGVVVVADRPGLVSPWEDE